MNAAADDDKHDAPVIHDDPSASAEADTKNAPRIHELFAADMIAQAAQAIAASASSYNIANYGSLTDPDAGCAAATATGNATDADIHNTSMNSAVIATLENHASSEESMSSAMTEALPSAASRHPSASVPNIPNLPNFPTETKSMDELLEEQKKAQLEIRHAEEEVQRAKDILDKATQHKLDIDARVKALTESSVDALLHENNRWNGMYKQLVEYKQENGHCHLVRSPKKKNSSEKCKLQALGIWASQARLDARRPVGHPDRLPPYKIHALDR